MALGAVATPHTAPLPDLSDIRLADHHTVEASALSENRSSPPTDDHLKIDTGNFPGLDVLQWCSFGFNDRFCSQFIPRDYFIDALEDFFIFSFLFFIFFFSFFLRDSRLELALLLRC